MSKISEYLVNASRSMDKQAGVMGDIKSGVGDAATAAATFFQDQSPDVKFGAAGAGVGLTLGTIIGYLVDGWRGAGVGAAVGAAGGAGAGVAYNRNAGGIRDMGSKAANTLGLSSDYLHNIMNHTTGETALASIPGARV
jgi:hypothetical protein